MKPRSAGEIRLVNNNVADLPIEVGLGPAAIAYLSCVAWAAAPWIVSVLTHTSLPEPNSLVFAPYYVVCGILSFGMTVLSQESVEYNAAHIEFAQLRGPARYIPWAVGLANGSAAFWLLAVGLWTGPDISSMAVIGQYLLVVTAGSVSLAVAETLLLYRAMPNVGTRPRYIGLHAPPSHVGNDHILLGFLLVVAVVVVYGAAVIAHYVPEQGWAIVPLAISSPLVAIFALYSFFFALTNVNTTTHMQQEAGRISNALLTRALGDPVIAAKENERRVGIIRKRFERLFGIVEKFSAPYLIYKKVTDFMSLVMSGTAESYELSIQRVSYPGAPRESHGFAMDWYVYRFKLVGFEQVPLDGNLYLSEGRLPPPGDPRHDAARVTLFKRDRAGNAGVLEVPLSADKPAGRYTLSIEIKDKRENVILTPNVSFEHPYVERQASPQLPV
jgi:hypothetical protein